MIKDEKKHPCKYCSIRITYANNWDIHFSGEDCPYECERYEKWKAEWKGCDGMSKEFYSGRIHFILEQHNFMQREQLLGMVMSAAMGDRTLTMSELMSVLSMIEEAHHKSLEVNYNEGWQV